MGQMKVSHLVHGLWRLTVLPPVTFVVKLLYLSSAEPGFLLGTPLLTSVHRVAAGHSTLPPVPVARLWDWFWFASTSPSVAPNLRGLSVTLLQHPCCV